MKEKVLSLRKKQKNTLVQLFKAPTPRELSGRKSSH